MVFLHGVSFLETRLVKSCLEVFYSIGDYKSSRIMAKYSIYSLAKMGELSNKTNLALEAELSTMTIETEAKKKVVDNIVRLRDMGTYRGRRHAMGLPVRGQRTRNQILTARRFNRVNRRA